MRKGPPEGWVDLDWKALAEVLDVLVAVKGKRVPMLRLGKRHYDAVEAFKVGRKPGRFMGARYVLSSNEGVEVV